ncbi:MAG: 50S ribosomal protein L15 [Rhodospirillales bacterium]|nr:50S ribosomal protein L15 [Rhodospirillales bacterium]
MKLNELKPKEGSKKKKLIVGRGIGSGKGKTCGSGQKGQKSRSGVAINGFEGGQMPLYMRMPKSGFNNKKFATHYAELTTGRLQAAIDTKKIDAKNAIDEDALVAAKIISSKKDGVKLLTKGELKSKIELKISKATKTAAAAVEKAGGKIEIIEKIVKPIENKKKK